MSDLILAWDLGTGGNKASLYDTQGRCVAAVFVSYNTTYPQNGWHEQRPDDWWTAVVQSTRRLLGESGVDPAAIRCCGISGHSLGAVPLDAAGRLLRNSTPIWSDGRAGKQAQDYFTRLDEAKWYTLTGNGFPARLYTIFKVMWYRDHEPELYSRLAKVVGTKDYINFRLTGRVCTDPSYASGSGVFDLQRGGYSPELLDASGVAPDVLPEIIPSTATVGVMLPEAAAELGLKPGVRVIAGGVDNSCMALGARAFREGRVYNSLGSSCWIAVSASRPLLDVAARPYVFAHVLPGMFASALCIASGGSSFRWVRDHIAAVRGDGGGTDPYDLMVAEARTSPPGAHRLLFNPSLGGGMPMDGTPDIRGAYVGMDLRHTRADLIRAAMEGIAFGQRLCLDKLRALTPVADEMLLVGGGSRSDFWRQIYADIYNMKTLKSNVDQQAAALGAAAVAAVGAGLWSSFDPVDTVHTIEAVATPDPARSTFYQRMLPVFAQVASHQAELGPLLAGLPTMEH